MTRKLLIVAGLFPPTRAAPGAGRAPFYHAAVAAAMDHQVDVICAATAATSGRCARAARRSHQAGPDKTVYGRWIPRRAQPAGRASGGLSSQPPDLFDADGAGLSPGVQGLMGAAAVLAQDIMSDDYRVLTFTEAADASFMSMATSVRAPFTTISTTRSFGTSPGADGTIRGQASRRLPLRSLATCAGVHAQARRQGLRGAALVRNHRVRQMGQARRGRPSKGVVVAPPTPSSSAGQKAPQRRRTFGAAECCSCALSTTVGGIALVAQGEAVGPASRRTDRRRGLQGPCGIGKLAPIAVDRPLGLKSRDRAWRKSKRALVRRWRALRSRAGHRYLSVMSRAEAFLEALPHARGLRACTGPLRVHDEERLAVLLAHWCALRDEAAWPPRHR